MKQTLGMQIVTKHGLISNLLLALPLETKLALACVCSRTYEITVPSNVPAL